MSFLPPIFAAAAAPADYTTPGPTFDTSRILSPRPMRRRVLPEFRRINPQPSWTPMIESSIPVPVGEQVARPEVGKRYIFVNFDFLAYGRPPREYFNGCVCAELVSVGEFGHFTIKNIEFTQRETEYVHMGIFTARGGAGAEAEYSFGDGYHTKAYEIPAAAAASAV